MTLLPGSMNEKTMQLRFSNSEKAPKRIAHRLPCTIHHDGDAPTARAFHSFPEPIKTFRGHRLQSAELNVPDSSTSKFNDRYSKCFSRFVSRLLTRTYFQLIYIHTGRYVSTFIVIFAQTDDSEVGNKDRLKASFMLENSGYFYQHDDPPDSQSAVSRALQWLSVSTALHSPTQTPIGTTQIKPSDTEPIAKTE